MYIIYKKRLIFLKINLKRFKHFKTMKNKWINIITKKQKNLKQDNNF